jgi:3-phosphoshikimate 1-carboxyvinyltransferase
MGEIFIEPGRQAVGAVRTPGDKSISHRALLISALAEGTSSITGLSNGEDVHATRAIITQLGVEVTESAGTVEVLGGRSRLHAAGAPLDCGNSGTTMRLVMGIVATLDGHHELVGDESLSRRPMDRVATPLTEMGATVSGVGDRLTPPISVEGGPLRAITYEIPVPSAQVKSALLFAGLAADGPSTVFEAVATRPNTEEMLAEAGASVVRRRRGAGFEITVVPSEPAPHAWSIPSDPSQAAFFLVAGLLSQSGEVRADALYADATRTGFLAALERMGGSLEQRLHDDGLLEVVARPSSLVGTTIEAREIPSVDEVPVLVVAACAARGVTRFVDVGELRVKESDRFAASVALARGLGAAARGDGDDLVVEGSGSAAAFGALRIDARGDHRVAMAAAIAGFVGSGATIDGFEAVATSYPAFLSDLESLR